jgi:CHAT domain
MSSSESVPANGKVLEDITSNLSTQTARKLDGWKSRRTIIVDKRSDGFNYTVIDEFHRVESYSQSVSDMVSLENDVRRVVRSVDDLSQRVHMLPEGRTSQLMQIHGSGKQLFDRVIPEKLRTNIRSWPSGTWVGISSDEDWIPWELLHDGTGFLADRFRIYRIPRRTNTNSNESRASDTTSTCSNRVIVHVIGGSLDDCADRSNAPFTKLKERATVRPASKIMVSQLSPIVVDADIVHFTCHGRQKPFRLQIADQTEASLNLTADALAVITFKPGSLIFANACGSARTESILGESLSFGWTIYAKGSFYIGTLGAVNIDVALDFADLFYDRLTVSGDLFDSFVYAREELYGKDDGVGHLLYCIYANPIETSKFGFLQSQ